MLPFLVRNWPQRRTLAAKQPAPQLSVYRRRTSGRSRVVAKGPTPSDSPCACKGLGGAGHAGCECEQVTIYLANRLASNDVFENLTGTMANFGGKFRNSRMEQPAFNRNRENAGNRIKAEYRPKRHVRRDHLSGLNWSHLSGFDSQRDDRVVTNFGQHRFGAVNDPIGRSRVSLLFQLSLGQRRHEV